MESIVLFLGGWPLWVVCLLPAVATVVLSLAVLGIRRLASSSNNKDDVA